LTECRNYIEDIQKVGKRNCRYDDDYGSVSAPTVSKELVQTPADKFRTGTFIIVIDRLSSELTKRLNAYQTVSKRFGFLRKLVSLPSKEILQRGSALVQTYPEDLESSFPTEAIHFSELLKTEFGKKENWNRESGHGAEHVSSHNRKCHGGLLSEHGYCTAYNNDGY